MAERRLGIIMHGVTGRMGLNQHLIRSILAIIKQGGVKQTHGVVVHAPDSLADDPGADHLDALLCAIQAAWAQTQKHNNYGLPKGADPLEGWIADPTISI